MAEFTMIYESSYLYELQVKKSKLESEGIFSYIKNEYVNNVAVMSLTELYQLWVNTPDAQQAIAILAEVADDGEA
ncbi:putative signal transducing protein [Bergeyella porcorum]|uniref:putative signal transducing protein n=1 Tax=Bergeyella porcorum TaxID=1735111 RepID=UPI0035EE1C9A